MAPPINYLKEKEEEWRPVFNRLCERFPTVPGAKVAQALRDHGGHAGEAASVLRDLTSSNVKQADPDDVEHVSTLLSSPAMFKHACKEQFRKYDVNKDGVLEWEEVKALVYACYEEFGLPVPSEGCLKAFFYATDENQDGVLSEREFRKFFEMFLRYAFFDHLKLQQMVEKGKEIEAKRESLGSIAPVARVKDEAVDDADTASPMDSRTSSASTSSKPKGEDQVPKASKAVLAPIESSQAKPGRRSPKADQERPPREDRQHREDRREDRQNRRQEKERNRASTQDSTEGYSQAMRCVAPNGVAYRNSASFQDRQDSVCAPNSTVRVLEHWIRTPEGWLPVSDAQGQTLFERSSADADDGRQHSQNSSKHSQKKQVSIQDNKDDTLDANVRSHGSPGQSAARSPAHSESGGGGGDGGGLKASEEEWRPVFERLSERFPQLSQDKILQALRDNDGHAGKAASMLRYM